MNTPEAMGVLTTDDLLEELRHILPRLNQEVGAVLNGTTDSAGGVAALHSAELLVAGLHLLAERALPMVVA